MRILVQDACVDFPSDVIDRRQILMELAGRAEKTTFRALDHISLDLTSGDRLGVVGRNGAGKSTFIRLMSGILPPTSGRVTIDGRVTSLIDLGVGLEENLTGIKNIALLKNLLLLGDAQEAEFEAYVARFSELGEALYRPVRSYSAGMKLRLIFSMQTFRLPEIFVIDEVIGVGDALFFAKAKKRMADLVRESAILVMASHDFEILGSFCNKAVLLEKGGVAAYGSVAEIQERYSMTFGHAAE